MTAYAQLLQDLAEQDHISSAARLLQWDQETGMPSGGESARAEVLSTLAKISHQRATDPRLRERATRAAAEAQGDDEKRQTELVLRCLDRADKVPSHLVERLVKAGSLSQQAWAKAKKDRDFQAFRPYLEEIVALKREEGALLAPAGGTSYDGLLDDFERGMRTADWTGLFDELERELPGLLREISERQAPERERLAKLPGLRGPFPKEGQLSVCRQLAEAIGYDFSRGRLDLSSHPFSETIHRGDSRITTRIDESELGGSVYSTLHETGHALYEQGLPEAHAGTPLGMFCSMSVHESQSRLWENLVGRSDDFWEDHYGILRDAFPALSGVSARDWAAHSRSVRASLIRTESDEVTYNLHVLVRFRLEKAMVQGELEVRDLPGEWNKAYRNMLGVEPAHDGEGCLQDVHWSAGMFGYFPTYTLGNLLSAQLLATARNAGAASDRATLLGWLRTNIHSKANRHEMTDLVRLATGRAPSASDFLGHLRRRYLPGQA